MKPKFGILTLLGCALAAILGTGATVYFIRDSYWKEQMIELNQTQMAVDAQWTRAYLTMLKDGKYAKLTELLTKRLENLGTNLDTPPSTK